VNVKPDVVASIAGARLIAVSSVVILDPRRRKFHRPVTVSVPLSTLPSSYPAAAASDLRLLCSLAGALSFLRPCGKHVETERREQSKLLILNLRSASEFLKSVA